jgi:hypothetical protein
MLGIALAGGLLIGLIGAGRHARVLRAGESPRAGEPAGSTSDHRRREISPAWRSLQSALIGVAAAKLKDTLVHVLPGFREQPVWRRGDGGRQGAAARYRSH